MKVLISHFSLWNAPIAADTAHQTEFGIVGSKTRTQQNINAFGGDPGKGKLIYNISRSGLIYGQMTIMGESAGAISVGHHINTMPHDHPFRAAVQISGSSIACAPSWRERPRRRVDCFTQTSEQYQFLRPRSDGLRTGRIRHMETFLKSGTS
jgi:hypothetical protein